MSFKRKSAKDFQFLEIELRQQRERVNQLTARLAASERRERLARQAVANMRSLLRTATDIIENRSGAMSPQRDEADSE